LEELSEIGQELDRVEADLSRHAEVRTRKHHRAEVALLDHLVAELNRLDQRLHLLRRAGTADSGAVDAEQDYADRLRTRVLHRRERLTGAALARIESAGAIITVAFLLPTLVAAVYGAEAAIPGRGPTESAAAYIVLGSVIVGFALAAIMWMWSRGPGRALVEGEDD
jgi:hypothetical protein